jgi:protein gp37
MPRYPLPVDPTAEIRPFADEDAEISHEYEALLQDQHLEQETGKRVVLRAKRLGDLLVRKRPTKRHGEWLPWLEQKVKIPQPRAYEFMLIARHWSKLSLSDNLGLKEAIRQAEEYEQQEKAPKREPAEPRPSQKKAAPKKRCSRKRADEAREPNDCEHEEPSPVFPRDRQLGPYVDIEHWRSLNPEQQRTILSSSGKSRFNDQGKNESIEWALWSWNPITGCLHDCPYCYARDIAERFYEGPRFKPVLWPERLSAPSNTPFPKAKAASWMGHKNVFVCSMADLFGRWVPREWIDAVLQRVRAAEQWTFLFLTKFPLRLAEFTFPDNAWVGTTVDCQVRVANAEKAFRKVKAGVKWLSLEPLLEPLCFQDLGAFQWIVLGGASASTLTPEWQPPRSWVLNIEQEAMRLGIPYYEKINLGRVRQYPGVPNHEPQQAPERLRYLPGIENLK